MLHAMMSLAVGGEGDDGLDPALRDLRTLAEFPDQGEVAYILRRDAAGNLRAEPRELDGEAVYDFPFIKPNGSQGAQLSPVIKRSFNAKKEVSPGEKILSTTLTSFAAVAHRSPPAYQRALDLLGDGSVSDRVRRLIAALASIPGNKTVHVSIGDPCGRDPEHARHLLGLLRAERYGIDPESTPAHCALCGELSPLTPNGLKGAGVNFANMDNEGKFPGFRKENADRRFAICAGCADGLRTFKNTVADDLKCYIAGESAIVIPEVIDAATGRSARRARDVVKRAKEGRGTSVAEDSLLSSLEKDNAVAAFHVLWAVNGQDLDNVSGLVTDVPRTRLAELSALNLDANTWQGPNLPRSPLSPELFDLRLSVLGDLLQHPGFDRVKKLNQGMRLRSVRRHIVRAVYGRTRLDEGFLYRELRPIAASYLREALDQDDRTLTWWLLREDSRDALDSAPGGKRRAPKSDRPLRLTCAGWIRHAALLLRYLRTLEVIDPMSDAFTPDTERLRPFFRDSGIRGDAAAFAFLLGALWGKLVTIQAARRVNVKSNSLSWLRRGALTGADLPGLFAQTRMKLLEYEFHSSDLADVLSELARIGRRLGDRIELDNDRTMYFLFLGQASTVEILPKKETEAS